MSENNSCVHIRFEELFNIPAVDTIHASIICVLTGAPRSGFRSAGGCPTLSRLSLSTHPHTAMPAYIVAFKTGDEVEASAVDDACAKVESSGGQSVPVSHTPHIRRMTHARPSSTRLTQADAALLPRHLLWVEQDKAQIQLARHDRIRGDVQRRRQGGPRKGAQSGLPMLVLKARSHEET